MLTRRGYKYSAIGNEKGGYVQQGAESPAKHGVCAERVCIVRAGAWSAQTRWRAHLCRAGSCRDGHSDVQRQRQAAACRWRVHQAAKRRCSRRENRAAGVLRPGPVGDSVPHAYWCACGSLDIEGTFCCTTRGASLRWLAPSAGGTSADGGLPLILRTFLEQHALRACLENKFTTLATVLVRSGTASRHHAYAELAAVCACVTSAGPCRSCRFLCSHQALYQRTNGARRDISPSRLDWCE